YVAGAQRRHLLSTASRQAQQMRSVHEMIDLLDSSFAERAIRYHIKYDRTFTLPVSCLLITAIGTPLRAMHRPERLYLPVVVAIIFFLIYHIISTMAEKAAKDGSMDPLLGMWMGIIVLTPLAVFLTCKSPTDSALFDADQYKQKFEKSRNWVVSKFK